MMFMFSIYWIYYFNYYYSLIISEELIDGKSAHDQESHVHPGANMQEICIVLSYHLKLANDLWHMGHVMLCQIWYIG